MHTGARESENRLCNPLELELQRAVRCHIGAENWTTTCSARAASACNCRPTAPARSLYLCVFMFTVRASDPLEPEIQAVRRCLIWALGTELRSSGRAPSSPKSSATSLAPPTDILKHFLFVSLLSPDCVSVSLISAQIYIISFSDCFGFVLLFSL